MLHYQKERRQAAERGVWAKQKGQALVELALVLPVLLLLIFGITEFGRALYIKNTLTNAAREGARRAVVIPLPWNLPNTKMSNLQNSIKSVMPSTWSTKTKEYIGVNATTPTTELPTVPSPVPVSGRGDTVTVRVTLPFSPIVGRIIPQLKDITLVGQASMRFEQ